MSQLETQFLRRVTKSAAAQQWLRVSIIKAMPQILPDPGGKAHACHHDLPPPAPSLPQQGQYGFLATVFEAFKRNRISVDVVATSEVSVSLTLDPKKVSDLDNDLAQLQHDLKKVAQVRMGAYHGTSRSIIETRKNEGDLHAHLQAVKLVRQPWCINQLLSHHPQPGYVSTAAASLPPVCLPVRLSACLSACQSVRP